jgi:hypothetical protein
MQSHPVPGTLNIRSNGLQDPNIFRPENINPLLEKLHAGFSGVEEVRKLFDFMTDRKVFTLAGLKRSVNSHLYYNSKSHDMPTPISKPNGVHVEEMFNPYVFRSGSNPLPEGIHTLKARAFYDNHCRSCCRCSAAGYMISDCYFTPMFRCITHGWDPIIIRENVQPVYKVDGNYPTITQYAESVLKEIASMKAHGVLRIWPYPRNGCIVHPLGAVVKSSDIIRARVLTGIEVKDQSSLTNASTLLENSGFSKIKCRIITDCTATGLNRAAYSPPFRYPSVEDGISEITPNCFMGKGDVTRYFHGFPLAEEAWKNFLVEIDGVLYCYVRCPFGFTLCPYFCSAFSAEFRRWIKIKVPRVIHMVDDWLVFAPSLQGVKRYMRIIASFLESIGFEMAKEKYEYGQQLTFLGVHFDSVRMLLSFESTQVKGFRMQLQSYLDTILDGRHLGSSTIRHVCGKLNWYGEVVQSARIHTVSWWDYQRHRCDLSQASQNRLISDTQWWISLLSSWESSVSAGIEYRIRSSEIICNDPSSIVILQSDASGTDGFGYYYGFHGGSDVKYFSRQWPDSKAQDLCSHTFEMCALLHFLQHHADAYSGILLWITDNQSAAWSVNKGRCKSQEARHVLTEILKFCDDLQIELIAVWIPREENALADFLSHLATYMSREAIGGNISDLRSLTSIGRSNRQ